VKAEYPSYAPGEDSATVIWPLFTLASGEGTGRLARRNNRLRNVEIRIAALPLPALQLRPGNAGHALECGA
jgi:hypothetical protein